MSLLVVLYKLLFLNSQLLLLNGSTVGSLHGKICFWDAMRFASCTQGKNNTHYLKHNEDVCADPCYFEAECTEYSCHQASINIIIRSFEVKFKMDKTSMVHSRVFCESNHLPDGRIYDFKLVCNKSFVKENSDIGSLCFRDNHCSSRQHLHCYTYKTNWQTSPYGFCKCRTGYIEHNRKCLQGNIALQSPCNISIQCQDHISRTGCFSHTDGFTKCLCKVNYLEDKNKCMEANLTLQSKCQNNNQCLDHESVTVCREGPHGRRCLCKPKYLEYENKCLKADVRVNQTCMYEVQCNGTENASICYKNRCLCNVGFIQSDEKCIKGDSEVVSQQRSKMSTDWILYLAISTGGGIIIGIFISMPVIFMILRKMAWKNFNRYSAHQSNRFKDFECKPDRKKKSHSVSNVLYRMNNEPLPCEHKNIYTSIDDFPYEEPMTINESQEGKKQYNYLFESEQKSSEDYSKTELPRDDTFKNQNSTASKKSEENNEAHTYFTLEKM